MNKFGLIDIFTKLSQDKNAVNLLANTVNTILNKKDLTPFNNIKTKTNNQEIKREKYSKEAILSLYKRHEEMSKMIDLNLKNEPPKK